MNKGWILVKPKFHDSYETKRLVEEFDDSDIKIRIIDPNEIDIFVNKDNKSSILVMESHYHYLNLYFQELVVEQLII